MKLLAVSTLDLKWSRTRSAELLKGADSLTMRTYRHLEVSADGSVSLKVRYLARRHQGCHSCVSSAASVQQVPPHRSERPLTDSCGQT